MKTASKTSFLEEIEILGVYGTLLWIKWMQIVNPKQSTHVWV